MQRREFGVTSSAMDWEAVKTFRAVMEVGTVRAAAKRLGLHHSTVSRRIEQLEKSLDSRLFERRPEGYFPTASGEELARVAERFAEELFTVERHIAGRDNELTGSLKVTMAEPFAITIFADRLPEFFAAYPGLNLEIITSFDLLDVARREADIAIRMDNNPPESLVGKRLFSYCSSIYANPDYLAEQDFDNRPGDARWLGWSDRDGRFPDWTQNSEYARVPVWGNFASIGLQVRLARLGLGLAMVPCIAADGVPGLVRATDREPVPARDIWILTHEDLRRTARVRAFMDFAEMVLRDNRAALQGVLTA
ncbi:MAG: LysR family transcriptional regulator [Sphingomonadales bacterium CG_4_10_14_3_um_filter_58_15]|nr:MAG: LysR family transcriptional regulator [Sphingomonadales bacterium CG_4_10_14_3_um_filter_58_15]